tara:strand:- start:57 stop:704 length:648 start_codon:yes stop_codon:yes gene_type:complete
MTTPYISPLKDFAKAYEPVTAALNPFNEFYSVEYFNYNPNVGRISRKWTNDPAGDLELNYWQDREATEKNGYLPLLAMQTTELDATCFIELGKADAEKMHRRTPNLFAYIERIAHRLWEAQEVRETTFLNWYDRKPGTTLPRGFISLREEVLHWSSQSVVLVLELGREDDAVLSKVISINGKKDWSYVWGLIPMPTMGSGEWHFSNEPTYNLQTS